MAKSKGGKSKSSGSLVEKLLKNAEKIALVAGAGGLGVLLISGVMEGVSAKSAEEHAKPLVEGSKSIQDRIRTGTDKPDAPPPWLVQTDAPRVDSKEFAIRGVTHDPTATPNNKRENPQVLGIENPQVDLVRAPMLGYDVFTDAQGRQQIAVITKRNVNPGDVGALKDVINDIQNRKRPKPRAAVQVPPMGPMGPMNPGFTTVPGGPMGGGIGMTTQAFDPNQKREETAIEYISLDSLDKSKKTPALTLIPLRLAVIQATFPLRRQMEEMQRALRFKKIEEVAQLAPPVFDGFEVRRQIYGPPGKDGKMPILQPMDIYDYETKFAEMIDARILGYHFDTGFLPYFLRFEEGLAWPLPQMVKELAGNYPPPLRLAPINAAMDELRNKSKQEVTPSDLQKRLGGANKPGRIVPNVSKGAGIFKDQLQNIPTSDAGTITAPKPGDPPPQAFDPEHLLIRFVDPDIQPGLTYEYQIRIRMKNPNFKQHTSVASPSYADNEILYGPWTQISDLVSVPTESFLYGYDSNAYTSAVSNATSDPSLRKALTPAPNQAVLQVQTWMEQVRVEGSLNREPVGAWVVAEMPVSRGEYIGRKQFLRLPLWSAEVGKFILRNVPPAILGIRLGKDREAPRGWMVDFSTKSILVDFEGGKVTGRVSGRTVTDEAMTEMLIVRPDGRLIVKNTAEDMKDPDRAARNKDWDDWLKDVQSRTASSSGTDSGFTVPKKTN